MGCFEGGGSESDSASYIPAQRKGLESLLGLYGPEVGKGQTSFPGSEVAEFTPTQKAAVGGAGGFLPSFGPAGPSNMPNYNQTNQAIGGLLGGELGAQKISPEQTQSFFKQAYQDPNMAQFENFTRPLAREEYSGPGFWGSGRANAVMTEGRELSQWLGQKRGEVEWQTGEANRAIDEAKAGRTLSTVPLAQNQFGAATRENQSRLAGRQGVFNFAGADQQQRQNMLNDSIKKFQEGKRLTDPEVLNIMMSLIGQNMQWREDSTIPPGMFGGQEGFGNIMSAGAAIGGAMSDIRLKENIEPIENALDKVMTLDGKTFNYIGKVGDEAGLIAQDLEKVLPESVVEDDKGMKAVKYTAVIALLVNAVKELAQRGQNGE